MLDDVVKYLEFLSNCKLDYEYQIYHAEYYTLSVIGLER